MSAETPIITATDRAGRFPVVPVMAVLILVGGALVGMPGVLAWVASSWYSFFGVGVYSHGYLVLGVAIWMGWTFWQRDPPAHLAPNWWALVPLALLSMVLILMELLYIGSLRALLLPLYFLAATALVFGLPAARRLLVPALFVYFGLLPWYLLNPFLQWQVTRVVEGLLLAFHNFPVYIESTTLHLPAGVIEVVSSCSGLSFLLSAAVITVFYGATYLQRWKHRVLLLAAAGIAALVANWIRIWTLVLIGHYSNLQHWLVDDHYLYGWVLFIVALVPVLFFARRMELREIRDSRNDSAVDRSGQGASIAGPAMILAAVAGALVLAAPRIAVTGTAGAANTEPLSMPAQLAGAAVRTEETAVWRPTFTSARMGRGVYEFRGRPVAVFVALYPDQARQQHLFIRENAFVGERLRDVGATTRDATINGERLHVIEYLDRSDRREAVVWAWYEIADRPATTRAGVKLLEIPALLQGRNDGSAFAVRAECTNGCDRARALLDEFLQEAGGELRRVISGAD